MNKGQRFNTCGVTDRFTDGNPGNARNGNDITRADGLCLNALQSLEPIQAGKLCLTGNTAESTDRHGTVAVCNTAFDSAYAYPADIVIVINR